MSVCKAKNWRDMKVLRKGLITLVQPFLKSIVDLTLGFPIYSGSIWTYSGLTKPYKQHKYP